MNAGKYMATIIVLFVAYLKSSYESLTTIYVLLYLVATIYSLTWDYVMDWGLFRGSLPGRKILRDRLKYPHEVYYFSMVTNFILRFSWVLTIFEQLIYDNTIINQPILFTLLALGEAYRRA
jgi:hypothetical protein